MIRIRGGTRAVRTVLMFALVAASCASLDFDRETATSGRFVSTGMAFTIVSIDLPKPAIDIARENASDAKMQNMQIEKVVVVPYLGWFDWVLDIIGVRYARISGSWGYPGS